MRLGQIKWCNQITAAIFEGGLARPIPSHTMRDLMRRSEVEGVPLQQLAAKHASVHGELAAPILPVHPCEVWACGCTYETSASSRDAGHGTREGFCTRAYREPRPEIFFKGTRRMCVGPGEAIGIRSDSRFTAPEPALALLLGSHGKILGYMLANDVSAWDIERENPLYLPQSKVYTACCALGPVIVTVDEIADPYRLEMSCTILRGGSVVFSGSMSTARLNRKFENLVEHLMRANPVPGGAVLLTGSGIVVTEEAAIEPGDLVSISVPEIGEISNPAIVV